MLDSCTGCKTGGSSSFHPRKPWKRKLSNDQEKHLMLRRENDVRDTMGMNKNQNNTKAENFFPFLLDVRLGSNSDSLFPYAFLFH